MVFVFHIIANFLSGALPSLVDVENYLYGAPCQSDDSWNSLKKASPKSILKMNRNQDIIKISSTFNNVRSTKISNSMFVSQEGSMVKGGTNSVLNALTAYLRDLEGTARDDWQEYVLRKAETRKGASFSVLFGSALYFGTISRRRVYYEAIKYEKERNAGFLSPFGYSAPTVAAAVDAVCSMEYTAVGNEGPAALLVHGFGAFLEHFRGNISNIADDGHRVWAISLLGFGKSEKPNVIYTELLWAELLRDFIVDVVREPVHLVGNSLGGMSELMILQSFDPGAAIVLESIVSFDLSIPLNYLLGSFGGEVLIIQGMKDPLTKSKAFLSMVREHCNKVTVSELDAGNWFNPF
ncbi:hypothetical protein BHM03_00019946 [Ensete ventricosum]|nr:hypothetical protein BHM03_00019946 [Ensete ventricosum]